MIHIDLTEKERAMLLQMLENDLGDLRMEISDTDSYEYREDLKMRKHMMMKIIETLRKSEHEEAA